MCNLIPQSTNRDDESRIDYYLEHLKLDRHALPPLIHYWVADGYYSNNKYIDGVVALGLHQIGKLRHDANLLLALPRRTKAARASAPLRRQS